MSQQNAKPWEVPGYPSQGAGQVKMFNPADVAGGAAVLQQPNNGDTGAANQVPVSGDSWDWNQSWDTYDSSYSGMQQVGNTGGAQGSQNYDHTYASQQTGQAGNMQQDPNQYWQEQQYHHQENYTMGVQQGWGNYGQQQYYGNAQVPQHQNYGDAQATSQEQYGGAQATSPQQHYGTNQPASQQEYGGPQQQTGYDHNVPTSQAHVTQNADIHSSFQPINGEQDSGTVSSFFGGSDEDAASEASSTQAQFPTGSASGYSQSVTQQEPWGQGKAPESGQPVLLASNSFSKLPAEPSPFDEIAAAQTSSYQPNNYHGSSQVQALQQNVEFIVGSDPNSASQSASPSANPSPYIFGSNQAQTTQNQGVKGGADLTPSGDKTSTDISIDEKQRGQTEPDAQKHQEQVSRAVPTPTSMSNQGAAPENFLSLSSGSGCEAFMGAGFAQASGSRNSPYSPPVSMPCTHHGHSHMSPHGLPSSQLGTGQNPYRQESPRQRTSSHASATSDVGAASLDAGATQMAPDDVKTPEDAQPANQAEEGPSDGYQLDIYASPIEPRAGGAFQPPAKVPSPDAEHPTNAFQQQGAELQHQQSFDTVTSDSSTGGGNSAAMSPNQGWSGLQGDITMSASQQEQSRHQGLTREALAAHDQVVPETRGETLSLSQTDSQIHSQTDSQIQSPHDSVFESPAPQHGQMADHTTFGETRSPVNTSTPATQPIGAQSHQASAPQDAPAMSLMYQGQQVLETQTGNLNPSQPQGGPSFDPNAANASDNVRSSGMSPQANMLDMNMQTQAGPNARTQQGQHGQSSYGHQYSEQDNQQAGNVTQPAANVNQQSVDVNQQIANVNQQGGGVSQQAPQQSGLVNKQSSVSQQAPHVSQQHTQASPVHYPRPPSSLSESIHKQHTAIKQIEAYREVHSKSPAASLWAGSSQLSLGSQEIQLAPAAQPLKVSSIPSNPAPQQAISRQAVSPPQANPQKGAIPSSQANSQHPVAPGSNMQTMNPVPGGGTVQQMGPGQQMSPRAMSTTAGGNIQTSTPQMVSHNPGGHGMNVPRSQYQPVPVPLSVGQSQAQFQQPPNQPVYGQAQNVPLQNQGAFGQAQNQIVTSQPGFRPGQLPPMSSGPGIGHAQNQPVQSQSAFGWAHNRPISSQGSMGQVQQQLHIMSSAGQAPPQSVPGQMTMGQQPAQAMLLHSSQPQGVPSPGQGPFQPPQPGYQQQQQQQMVGNEMGRAPSVQEAPLDLSAMEHSAREGILAQPPQLLQKQPSQQLQQQQPNQQIQQQPNQQIHQLPNQQIQQLPNQQMHQQMMPPQPQQHQQQADSQLMPPPPAPQQEPAQPSALLALQKSQGRLNQNQRRDHDRPSSRQGDPYGDPRYQRPSSRQGYDRQMSGNSDRSYGSDYYRGYRDDRYGDPRYRGYYDQPSSLDPYDPYRPPSRGGYLDESYDRPRSRQEHERPSSRSSSRPSSRQEVERPKSRSGYEGDYYRRDDYYRRSHREDLATLPRFIYLYDYYSYYRDPYYNRDYERDYYDYYYRQDRYAKGYAEEMKAYGQPYDERSFDQTGYDSDYDRHSDRHSYHSQSRGSTPGPDSGADHFAQEHGSQPNSRPSSRPSSRASVHEPSPSYSSHSSHSDPCYNDPRYGYDRRYEDPYAYDPRYSSRYDPRYDYSYQDYEQKPEEPKTAGRLTPVKFPIAHVTSVIGPTGQLIKVLPNRPAEGQPAVVVIQDMSNLLMDQKEAEELKLFPGPLIKGDTHKNDVLLFCQKKVSMCRECAEMVDRDSAILLWRYLELLIKQNGTVVGTDIADLLLEGQEVTTVEYSRTGMKIFDDTTGEDVAGEAASNLAVGHEKTLINKGALSRDESTDRFRHLLLYGRKKDALEWAIKHNLWGHALFLASKMDAKTHASVMTRDYLIKACNKFANMSMRMNDPLQTLYQLMSGRQPAAVTLVADEKWGHWRPHLAMILSNQTTKADVARKSMITLGDTLASKGYLYASHFCYLIAPVQLGSYSQKSSSKVVLIGSSHSQPFETFASNEAIQCTEIYEYALSLGNPRFVLRGLQMFKFLYATRLAENGLPEEALHYCEVLGNTMRLEPNQYPEHLVSQVYQLASKLKHNDPQRLQMGEDFGDPLWLTDLEKLCQDYAGGSVQYNPSTTPMGFTGSSASSELGDASHYIGYDQTHQQAYVQQYQQGQATGYQHHWDGSQQWDPSQWVVGADGQYVWVGHQQQAGAAQTDSAQQQHTEEDQADAASQQQQQQQQAAAPEQQYQWTMPTSHNEGTSHSYNQWGASQPAVQDTTDGGGNVQTQQVEESELLASSIGSQISGGTGEAGSNLGESGSQEEFDYYGMSSKQAMRRASISSRPSPPSSPSSKGSSTPRAFPGSPKHSTPIRPDVFSFGSPPPNSMIHRASAPSVPLGASKKEEGSSNIPTAAPPPTKNEKKSPKRGGGGSWIGSIFSKLRPRGPNEMILPDDKNPAIVWDSEKKKWINTDGDEDESSIAALPPPKDSELPGGNPPGPGRGAAGAPPGGPPPSSNKFSRQKSRGARGQYVDVFGGSKSKAAPSNLFDVLPKSMSVPANLFLPGEVDQEDDKEEPAAFGAAAGDAPPPPPAQQQQQPMQLYKPGAMGGSTGAQEPQNPQVTNVQDSTDGLSRSSSMSSLSREVQQLTGENTEKSQPAPPQPQMPLMFNPSTYSQDTAPHPPASGLGRGPRYGQRRAYPR